jgi:Domain of unknown function (DUF4337)
MDAHETHETIHETAHHGGPQHHTSRNRKVAVLISVLAALLAIVETGGKSAQTTSLAANIEAANLWSFFQAKTIRKTTMVTAADALAALADANPVAQKTVSDWRAAAGRYESEPETGEGRKELAARAKSAEERRDHALAAYHLFEYGAGALQISIVLASSAVVTGMIALAFAAGGLGLVGIGFAVLAWLAPLAVHL